MIPYDTLELLKAEMGKSPYADRIVRLFDGEVVNEVEL